ncbi:MAG: hypothetical protein ACE5JM_05295 [Armatimonadota bacterium]
MTATHRAAVGRLLYPRTRGKRAGIAFVFAIIALAVLLILGVTFVQMGIHDVRNAGVYKRQVQTQQLAEAALDRCVWMMQQEGGGADQIRSKLNNTGHYYSPMWVTNEGAAYSFIATAPYNGIASTVLLTTQGRAANGEMEELRIVLKFLPSQSEVFGHALYSNHNLRVGGTTFIDGHPELGGAGVYANGNIKYVGNTTTTIGDIHATGSITGNTNQQPPEAVQVEYAPQMGMPEIDIEWYRANCDTYYAGDVSITGGTLGDWDDPHIIFVDGLAKISGTFEGVGTIVTTEGFKVTGNIDYADGGSALAMLTIGDFLVAGTVTINGLIYAHSVLDDSSFGGTGTPTIFGGVCADVIDVSGTINVEWDPRLKDIKALPGFKGQVQTLSWERL